MKLGRRGRVYKRSFKASKRRRGRVRSCSSIYRKLKASNEANKGKKKGKTTTNRGPDATLPTFWPGSRNHDAGESITDNGIENRNRWL